MVKGHKHASVIVMVHGFDIFDSSGMQSAVLSSAILRVMLPKFGGN